MKPAPFRYVRAHSLEHAVALLAEHGDGAKILAGGQSLLAAMNFRLARPEVLIDISNIAQPDEVLAEAGGVRIKATTRQAHAENHPLVVEHLPVLRAAIGRIAHVQVRNKGTVGGSIVNADPASELPAMTLLLDAELEILGSAGRYTVAAEDFYITYMTTALGADEVLASVLFRPPPAGSGWSLHEVARRDGDFALVGSAAVMALDDGGCVRHLRAVLFGVAATPVRVPGTEQALLGAVPTDEAIAAACAAVADVVDAETDVHVTAAYRARTATVLMERALRDARERIALTA